MRSDNQFHRKQTYHSYNEWARESMNGARAERIHCCEIIFKTKFVLIQNNAKQRHLLFVLATKWSLHFNNNIRLIGLLPFTTSFKSHTSSNFLCQRFSIGMDFKIDTNPIWCLLSDVKIFKIKGKYFRVSKKNIQLHTFWINSTYFPDTSSWKFTNYLCSG